MCSISKYSLMNLKKNWRKDDKSEICKYIRNSINKIKEKIQIVEIAIG